MFSNVIDLLFNCACFIYIGMVIPFSDWNNAATSVSAIVQSQYFRIAVSDDTVDAR